MWTERFRPSWGPREQAWKLVMGFALLAWFIKCTTQIRLFFQASNQAILTHSQLPDWLCRPDVGGALYLLPALLIATFWVRKIWMLRAAAVLYGSCSLLMLWHVQSYNDATYVTGFWTSLWLLWWAGQIGKSDETSKWHGIFMGMSIISLCFLGGAVGKLSKLYWDGEPFYYLYFMDKPHFPFSWMRSHYAEETLRNVAAIFARMVIITEVLLGTCVLWPLRLAVVAVILTLAFMLVASQLQLFSVLGPLIGLALGSGLIYEKDIPLPAFQDAKSRREN